MMCGLFGFIGHSVDQALLEHLAVLAGRRGPHASGWAWWRHDKLEIRRQEGSSERNAGKLPRDATVLIGHSRLCTSGAFDDLSSAQPILVEGLAFAHNGVARTRIPPPDCETTCDSEALARIAAAESGSLADKLSAAVDSLDPETPFAIVAASDEGIAAARRGLPLFVNETLGGAYLCSVATNGAHALQEETISSWLLPREARDGR